MAWIRRKAGTRIYLVRWREDGKLREQSTRTRDRSVALSIKAEIERRVAMRASGLVSAADERRALESKRSLEQHVADFERMLRAEGRSSKHVAETIRRVRELFSSANAVELRDVTPSRIQAGLAKRREEHSDRGANKDLTALRSLLRWLVVDGRIAEDPCVSVRPFKVVSEPHRKRRSLSAAECAALVAVAEAGPKYRGLSGRDRAMLYRLALGTGFRVSEIASLTRESFALEQGVVIIAAAYSKARKEVAQPIRADLVDALRPWLAGKRARARVFPIVNLSTKTAEMVRFDASRAGIETRDDRGEVDFHALRHTYVSALVAGGASVKEAQTLARHSDPKLTIGIYSHVDLPNLTRALDALPKTSTPEAVSATGTDGGGHSNRHTANADSCGVVRVSAKSSAEVQDPENRSKQEDAVRNQGVLDEAKVVAGLGFEPRLAESESGDWRRKSKPAKGSDAMRKIATQSGTLSLVDVARELEGVRGQRLQAVLQEALLAIRRSKGGAR